MCLPLCLKKMRGLSRREFLGASVALAAGTSLAQDKTPAAEPIAPFRFSRVVDLTHTLSPDFPTAGGNKQFTMDRVMKWPKDPWNIFRWHIHEHTGTHMDAPLHKSDNNSADLIPAEQLVGPLAIIDIRRKAASVMSYKFVE